MNITIRADEGQKNELLQKGFNDEVKIQWLAAHEKLTSAKADAVFDLLFNDNDPAANNRIDEIPVFVHAVNCTCREIGHSNYIRMNAWNGFINRSLAELACVDTNTQNVAEKVLQILGWKFVWVKDDYGLVSARIIAMIINEAYFTLEENVSTKPQIDIAMKLGTNYPFGPFEWGEIIGLKHITYLLQRLQQKDSRYTISSLLIKESGK
jgi:3-hydroxybutyryl-CoA dehydrogenase